MTKEKKLNARMEAEVPIPATGLLSQCYCCLEWEAEGKTERFKSCGGGDDTFWYSSVSNPVFSIHLTSQCL